MAAFYLLGLRGVPGIFIGAAVINSFGFQEAAANIGFLPVLLSTIGISFGSVIQACVGGYFIHRVYIRDKSATDLRMLIRLFLSVAVTCLISSSIGAVSLFSAGMLEAGRLAVVWSTWWLGDLVGVVLFVPLIIGAVFHSRKNVAVLAVIAIIGIAAAHYTSVAARDEARDAWENNASQVSGRLTSTTLLWLDLAYAPVNSLVVLFGNSEFVDDQEFIAAIDVLEDNEPDFFPSSVSFAASLETGEQNPKALERALLAGTGKWEVVFSTDDSGPMAPGVNIAGRPDFSAAVASAIRTPGQVVLGAFTHSSNAPQAIVTATIEHGGRAGMLVGLVDIQAILDGLFKVQVPDGVSLRLDAKGANAGFDAPLQRVWGQVVEPEAGYTTGVQRAVTAGASLHFRWYFSDDFAGGPGSILADGLFIGGVLVTAGMVLFLSFLMGQNREIRERVVERTAELADREKILRTALDNMSDGMFMLDEKMRYVVLNNRYRDYVGFSDDLIDFGKHVEGVVRAHAERGDYGAGEIDALVRARLETLASDVSSEREMRLGDGSKILQLRKAPIDGGGAVVVVTDVSDVTRAREKLQKSEEEIRLTLDNMPGGICMLDSDLRIQVVNQTYCDLYGHDPEVYAVGRPIEEVINMNVRAGIHAKGAHVVDDHKETVRRRMAMLRSGEPGETERELPNGRTLLVRHNPIHTGGVVLVATDITERKKAENRLSSIVETASDGIIVIDSCGTIMTFSPAAEHIFGYMTSEVIGKNVRSLMPEPDRSAHDGYIQHYHDTREKRIVGTNREVTGLRKDGSEFPMDLAIGEAKLGDETVFTGIVRDITERKNAQDLIRQQQQQLRAIIDNIPMVIILKDRQGRHLTVNSYYERATGIRPDEIVGLRDDEFLSEEVARTIMEVDNRIMKAKEAETFEEQVPHPDGSAHDYLTTKVPILDPEGGVETLVIAALDITDRKVAERKLTDAYEVISSSIQYASRIQQAVLTGREMLTATMEDSFSLWEPRDVVGGDIFWCRPWGEGVLVIAADCTGHGVPGAFMTLISAGALDLAIGEVEPGAIGNLVQQMHLLVQFSLNQHGGAGESDDGLELSAAYINIDASTLTFAGARMPLYIVENGEVTEVKGTKSGIGYRGISQAQEFEETEFPLRPEAAYYISTDGLIDQIGGDRRRAFGKMRFKELLLSVQGLPFEEQKQRIHTVLVEYQGDESRRDDVTVIGFRP